MRKFLAFVLALALAIPMLIGSLVMLSVKPWVLNRDFYKKSLTDDRLYASIDSLLAIEEKGSVTLGGVSFDSAALRYALVKALPRADLKAFGSDAVDSAFNALESKTPGKKVVLDYSKLKASLKRNAKPFVSAYAEKLPAGTATAFNPSDLSSIPQGMGKAKFEASALPLVQQGIDSGFKESSFSFPDFSSAVESGPFKGNAVKAYSAAMFASLVMAFVAWILCGMLWPKPWSSRLPFMGGVLIFSSLGILAIGVAGSLLVNAQSVMHGLAFFDLPLKASADQLAPFKGYIASLAATMSKGFFITGIVAASVGACLVSMRWVAAAREI
jgi:hypothetical protein